MKASFPCYVNELYITNILCIYLHCSQSMHFIGLIAHNTKVLKCIFCAFNLWLDLFLIKCYIPNMRDNDRHFLAAIKYILLLKISDCKRCLIMLILDVFDDMNCPTCPVGRILEDIM